MKITAEELKRKARELGADLVGIAPVARWENAPAMLRPTAHLPEAKSVIALSIHHPDASVEWGGLPNSNYSGPFQLGMIPKLDTISWRLCKFLESYGYASIPLPCTGFWRHRPYKSIDTTNTASFSHRHAFVAAGLGEFGWNNMALSYEYGPRNRLVSLITEAELEGDPLYSGDPLCDRCGMCEHMCPGKNYRKEMMLEPGYDEVCVEDKKYRYAKLNRFRCLWGEQFALDMDKLIEVTEDLDEEKMYKLIESGISRPGGEFGNCFRFCMNKQKRKWDKKYTAAPRRLKEKSTLSPEEILKEICKIAADGGADRIAIQKNDFPEAADSFVNGYPVKEFNAAFPYVITLGRTLPEYPLDDDNRKFLSVTTKVRVGMAAMDIARYLDDLGWEATQDWTETNNFAAERAGWKKDSAGPARATSTGGQSCFDIIADRAKQNIVIAGMSTTDVEKNEQPVSSNSLFTNCPLPEVSLQLEINPALSFENIDKTAVVSAEKLRNIPGIADPETLLPGCKSVIVFLTSMPERMVELAANQEAECAMSYAYSQYQLIRETLWAAHDKGFELEKQGFRAIPIADMASEPIRNLAPYWEFAWAHLGHPDLRQNAPAAAAAKLGEIGANGMLITPEFGPRQRFSFLLTTAELPETPDQTGGKKLCSNCKKCAEACPMCALTPQGDVYPRDEKKCRWERTLGMVPESGVSCVGWDIKPGEFTENDEEALSRKDPLQLKGYKYANQIDTVVERCMQVCPVGRKETKE